MTRKSPNTRLPRIAIPAIALALLIACGPQVFAQGSGQLRPARPAAPRSLRQIPIRRRRHPAPRTGPPRRQAAGRWAWAAAGSPATPVRSPRSKPNPIPSSSRARRKSRGGSRASAGGAERPRSSRPLLIGPSSASLGRSAKQFCAGLWPLTCFADGRQGRAPVAEARGGRPGRQPQESFCCLRN